LRESGRCHRAGGARVQKVNRFTYPLC
jgi:hypothetical protein